MAGNKRAREVARAKYERQEARRAAAQAARRRRLLLILGAAGALLLICGLAFAFWPGKSTSTASPTPSSTSTAPPAPVPTPAGVSCTNATPVASTKTYPSPPAQHLQPGATLKLATNCGDIVIAMDVAQAPKTTNALAFLASQGFYTNKNCHRLVVSGIYVLQCGSQTLTGQGNPGFVLPDENLPKAGQTDYPAGSVAMANAGPKTGNSQFFLVYKDMSLPPSYTIWGHITSGLNVVQYVAAKGVAPGSPNLSDGPPAQPVIIKSATVGAG